MSQLHYLILIFIDGFHVRVHSPRPVSDNDNGDLPDLSIQSRLDERKEIVAHAGGAGEFRRQECGSIRQCPC